MMTRYLAFSRRLLRIKQMLPLQIRWPDNSLCNHDVTTFGIQSHHTSDTILWDIDVTWHSQTNETRLSQSFHAVALSSLENTFEVITPKIADTYQLSLSVCLLGKANWLDRKSDV